MAAKQRKPHAPAISAVLAANGFPKAGRYTAWGYVDKDDQTADGFIVRTHYTWRERRHREVAGVRVYVTGFHHANPAGGEMADRIVEVLCSAGYNARREGRHGAYVDGPQD